MWLCTVQYYEVGYSTVVDSPLQKFWILSSTRWLLPQYCGHRRVKFFIHENVAKITQTYQNCIIFFTIESSANNIFYNYQNFRCYSYKFLFQHGPFYGRLQCVYISIINIFTNNNVVLYVLIGIYYTIHRSCCLYIDLLFEYIFLITNLSRSSWRNGD